MERLNQKKVPSIDAMLHKFEILLAENQLSTESINVFQKNLDVLEKAEEVPNYKLYQQQALIYYAKNEEELANDFIADALELEDNLDKYTNTGKLLAKLYLKEYKTNSDHKTNKAKTHKNKFNGKLEGWLALYGLRIIILPFITLYDIYVFNEILSNSENNYAAEARLFILVNLIIFATSLIVLYNFFAKRKIARKLCLLFESSYAIYLFLAAILFHFQFSALSIDDMSSIRRILVTSLFSILWALYWTSSKRAEETFVR